MIVAPTATLFIHGINQISGDEAAMAIQPLDGRLAGTLFSIGIINAGFMGLVIAWLSTANIFAEFFGASGSLDDNLKNAKHSI